MSAPTVPVARVALRVGEAAAALGVSPDHFATHIAPELPWVRTGRCKLVPVRTLEAWCDRNASRITDDLRVHE